MERRRKYIKENIILHAGKNRAGECTIESSIIGFKVSGILSEPLRDQLAALL